MEDAENLQHLKLEMEECRWDVFIEEILPRLSAKNLQTFKTVCKNWYRIIRSPYFVKLHLNVYNQRRILIFWLNNRGDMMTAYKYNTNSDEEETKQIPVPHVRCENILGSCDGLLCLFHRDYCEIGLYNPSTGKYFRVELCPPLRSYGCSIYCSWFGRNPSSGEYVVVLVFRMFGELHSEVGIYRFTRSNLELIHSTFCCIPTHISRIGAHLHGTLHWVSIRNVGNQRCYIICAYHLDVNKYSEISPPVQCNYFFKLGVVEGRLLAIFKPNDAGDVFELWIMKEYGIEQSWTKYADIPGFKNSPVLTPLGYLLNGDLIFDAGRYRLIKYSINDNKAIPLTPLTDPNYDVRLRQAAIMCAVSLVAPTIVVGEGVVE